MPDEPDVVTLPGADHVPTVPIPVGGLAPAINPEAPEEVPSTTVDLPAVPQAPDTVGTLPVPPVSEVEDPVRYDVDQDLTDEQKAKARANIGAVDSDEVVLFSTPRITSQLANIDNRDANTPALNQLSLLAMGDSLGNFAGRHILRIFNHRIGQAGRALEALAYTTTGVVDVPGATEQRRLDIWGTGMVRTMHAGSTVTIGQGTLLGLRSFSRCNACSVYFGTTLTGGTVDIEYSRDDGTTWTMLEAGVDTSNPAGIEALIKSYTFTTYRVRLRLTCQTGEIELIGAKLWNNKASGLMYANTNTGSLTLGQFMGAPSAVWDAVIDDLAPHGIINQWSESGANMDAHFSNYIDQHVARDPDCDLIWFTEHPTNAGSTVDADVNDVARQKSRSVSSLRIWESANHFGGYQGITSLGWNSTDIIHLTGYWNADPAWKFQASLLLEAMAPVTESGAMRFAHVFQDSLNEHFQYEKQLANVKQLIKIDDDKEYRFSIFAEDATTYAKNEWAWIRRANNAGNPNGFELYSAEGGLGKTPMSFDKAGKLTLLNLKTPKFDASGLTTAADDAAAASAGVSVGYMYKTATGEIRYRVA